MFSYAYEDFESEDYLKKCKMELPGDLCRVVMKEEPIVEDDKLERRKLKKRVRKSNWCEEEKHLLTALVIDRKMSVETKNSDTESVKRKQQSWKEIDQLFRLMFPTRRLPELKLQWKRIKLGVKKKQVEINKVRQENGLLLPAMKLSVTDILVLEALPEQFSDDPAPFDSDPALNEVNPASILDHTNESKNPDSDDEREVYELQNHREILETFKNEEIRRRNTLARARSQKCMNAYEVELLKLQKVRVALEMRHMQEIHELQLKHMRELHELKKESLLLQLK